MVRHDLRDEGPIEGHQLFLSSSLLDDQATSAGQATGVVTRVKSDDPRGRLTTLSVRSYEVVFVGHDVSIRRVDRFRPLDVTVWGVRVVDQPARLLVARQPLCIVDLDRGGLERVEKIKTKAVIAGTFFDLELGISSLASRVDQVYKCGAGWFTKIYLGLEDVSRRSGSRVVPGRRSSFRSAYRAYVPSRCPAPLFCCCRSTNNFSSRLKACK